MDDSPNLRDSRPGLAGRGKMMGGDGAGGLALAIGIAMIVMVLGGLALFAFVGRALTRRSSPGRRRLVTILMALVGLVLGWLLVVATFYESGWSPPPRLTLTAPPGFDAPVVILLEDNRAPQTLAWQGGGLPFSAATAELVIPPSGVARVRSLGPAAGRGDLEVVWADGRPSPGAGGGPGPPGTGATSYIIIERPDAQAPSELLTADPAAIGAYVWRREQGR